MKKETLDKINNLTDDYVVRLLGLVSEETPGTFKSQDIVSAQTLMLSKIIGLLTMMLSRKEAEKGMDVCLKAAKTLANKSMMKVKEQNKQDAQHEEVSQT